MCECGSVFIALETLRRTMQFSQGKKGTKSVYFNLCEYKHLGVLKNKCRTWKMTEHGTRSERGSTSRL